MTDPSSPRDDASADALGDAGLTSAESTVADDDVLADDGAVSDDVQQLPEDQADLPDAAQGPVQAEQQVPGQGVGPDAAGMA